MEEEINKKDSKTVMILSTVIGLLIIAALITGILSFRGNLGFQDINLPSFSGENSADSPLGQFFSGLTPKKKSVVNLTATLKPKESQDITFTFKSTEPLTELELTYHGKENYIQIGQAVRRSDDTQISIYNFSGNIHIDETISIDGKTIRIIKNNDESTFEKDAKIKANNLTIDKMYLRGIKDKTFLLTNVQGPINIVMDSEELPIIKRYGDISIEDFSGDIEYSDGTYIIKGSGSVTSDFFITK